MACGCHKKKDTPDHEVMPDEPCLFCAEKHLSTAMALAHETGYRSPNRQRMIGELVLCSWHVCQTHPALAAQLKDLRHLIEYRKDTKALAMFPEIVARMNELVESEINLQNNGDKSK